MPRKPMKPCSYSGCPNLTEVKYCEQHKCDYGTERESAYKRGYNSKWRTARNRFLKLTPLCTRCQIQGDLVKATVVDHINPHRGNQHLFWDESNWQSLCKKCHDKKTMTEDRNQEYSF